MAEVATVEPDWTDIEKAYRVGRDPLRTIAQRNGISEGAIRKRARRDGWERDLAGKISAKAEVLVRKSEVRKQVRKDAYLSEKREIEVAATIQAEKIIAHRLELSQWRDIEMQLMTELVATSGNIELMSQIGELMASPDEAGIDKLNELYRKAISLPGRVDSLKKLAEVREKRINLERRVFNIKDDDGDDERVVKIHEIRLVGVRPQGRIIDMEDA